MKTFKLRVCRTTNLTAAIREFDLVPVDPSQAICIEAGAHIVLHLPNGTSRRYSLTNGPAETDAYRIAVLKEENSRGASRYMHTKISEGSLIHSSGPFNHLPVDLAAGRNLLIAGGIGITPVISIARHLHVHGMQFKMHYCAKSRASAAFVEDLEGSPFRDSVTFHFSDDPAMPRLDIQALIDAQPDDTHVYFCGPERLMQAIKTGASQWEADRLHSENFSGSSINAGTAKQFEVVIASTGKVITVPAARSLLDVLWDHGFRIDYVCKEGICGSCLVDVLEGIPEHRDDFQTATEKERNEMIATCCSRSLSDRLVLDI